MLDVRSALVLCLLLNVAPVFCDLWAWECQGDGDAAKCVKIRSTETSNSTFAKCRLTCGPYGSLLPRPKQATLGNSVVNFDPDNINITLSDCSPEICSLIRDAISIMIENIVANVPSKKSSTHRENKFLDNSVSIHVNVTGEENQITLTTDESYTLEISVSESSPHITTANITAPNFFGARHGLETLSQLTDYDENLDTYEIINYASIIDSPSYPYRGVIVDTGRNFMPIDLLKKTVDAMSFHKLNTFHWHIAESQAFPMTLENLPNMTLYGAYSSDKVYSKEDMSSLVDYANTRGIRVLPEFDAPAHTGHGWDWGAEAGLGDLIVCLDKQPWDLYCAGPPCGQLNLANENMYTVLGQVYKDMLDIFGPVDIFHYGGDEVNIECWNTSTEIVDWMTANGNSRDEDSYYSQWSIFQERAWQLFTEANNGSEIPGIIWTSSLTENGQADQYLNKTKYIIQIWSTKDDPLIAELLQKGFKVLFSNYDAFYLDCGTGSWVGNGNNWCAYSGWQTVYDNNFRKIAEDLTGSSQYQSQILGGEGAVWSEQVDENNLEVRLWPRGAALAERLWTDPDTDYSYAEARMISNRERIVRRGVRADRIYPEWCAQNTGECRLPSLPKPGVLFEETSLEDD